MVALELRFVQEKADDGHLVYRLEPSVFPSLLIRLGSRNISPIDVFVTYDGKRATDIAVSRYAVRHLVAGKVSYAFSNFL